MLCEEHIYVENSVLVNRKCNSMKEVEEIDGVDSEVKRVRITCFKKHGVKVKVAALLFTLGTFYNSLLYKGKVYAYQTKI